MDILIVLGIITLGVVGLVAGIILIVKMATQAFRRHDHFTFTTRVHGDDNIIAVGQVKYGREFYCPACDAELHGVYVTTVTTSAGTKLERKSCACLKCKHEVTQYDGMMVAHRGKRLPNLDEIIAVTTGPPRVMPDEEE